ncbi:hypothetical protein [Flavobacterium sp. LC2016-12]|uniref:hypothetical protein n=1 Tax=Flavobacterium sp. LC2016-12 TaxID=2783794 RepID=UPI00188C9972|nr:hypothetical protein [Flavobacterium sp. LC2016-12]MBF4466707.1 hypothetical protein [Flavobacterium sp. LC2016-12]
MKNFVTKVNITGTLLLLFVAFGCSDFDDNLHQLVSIEKGNPEKVIQKDSELYKTLQKTTSDEAVQEGEVPPCVEFIYPLNLRLYDSNLNSIGIKNIISDANFSAVLENLSDGQSLSISYPITTTLADNTTYSVNNNEELNIALKNCTREDIIKYCNDLFAPPAENPKKYFWKVKYSETGDNTYFSGKFSINPGGSMLFYYDNKQYSGTWFFLFVDDKLHLNIKLDGDSAIAKYWSVDREIEMNGVIISIKALPKNINLEIIFESTATYKIGDTGPAKGIVFYDKGEYSFGWRYMEVATKDLKDSEWGCSKSSIITARNTELGHGYFNTAQIVNHHDNMVNYYLNPSICNNGNNGTVQAKDAVKYSQYFYTDWFLPSTDELELIYKNLYLKNIGGFSNLNYWSSTESDEKTVLTIDFKTGEKIATPKIPQKSTTQARVIRYF